MENKIGDKWIEEWDEAHNPDKDPYPEITAKYELERIKENEKMKAMAKRETEIDLQKRTQAKIDRAKKKEVIKTPDRVRDELVFLQAVSDITKVSTCQEVAGLLNEALDTCCKDAFFAKYERSFNTNQYEKGYEKGHEHATNGINSPYIEKDEE